MRCAIYVRVSTDEQVKEGYSIPAQKERLKAFCLSQGWEIVEEYIEEGWSAKNLERPKMQKMLKDVKRKNIDIILVYRLDRLTRSVLDLYNLLKTFDKYEVSFKSATEVYDTSTAMGRLFITLVAALAQWERENLAERVKFGMEQMIDQNRKPGGHNPLGYHFDNDFNCTIVEEEAELVQKIFKWYSEGFGYRSIRNRLNELGIKPKWAKEWSANTIRSILLNDMYLGIYRWGTKVKYDNHPPIVSEDLFKKVQKVMKSKTTSSSRIGKNPLTGILRCGHCDEKQMQGYFDKRDQKLYYRCQSCNRITQDKKILEPLLDELEKLVSDKEYFKSKFNKQSDELPDLSSIESEIEKIQKQKEKWYDVFMDPNNPIPKEILFEKINKLNEKEQDLQLQLNHLDINIDDETPEQKYQKIKHFSEIKNHYFKAESFHQKELLYAIFDKVVIMRDRGKNKPITLTYALR